MYAIVFNNYRIEESVCGLFRFLINLQAVQTPPKIFCRASLRQKCPYLKFFWSVFYRIWTEYGDLLRKSRIQSECGKTWTIQSLNTGTFYAVHFSRTFKAAIL